MLQGTGEMAREEVETDTLPEESLRLDVWTIADEEEREGEDKGWLLMM